MDVAVEALLAGNQEWVKEPEALPDCDLNKEIVGPDKKGFSLINNVSWLSRQTRSIRCPTALIRSNMTALVARD